MVELDVNVIGRPAQKNLVDVLRYEPGFSLDLIADLAVPIGEYDSSRSLNIGQNRCMAAWARPSSGSSAVGAGPAHDPGAPARRVALREERRLRRQTLETDPMFQVDAHLTRDFTERIWGALDGVWYTGGKATVGGVEGEKLDNLGIGITLGTRSTTTWPHRGLQVDHQRQGSRGPPDGRFMVSLVAGWHPSSKAPGG